MADELLGKQINDFLIEERLGQGAMAVVYKAFQPSISRHVALKVIRLDQGQGLQEEFRKRFAREAEVIARLEHIHILPIYDYGISEEMAYLAMRWLKGGSLSELMRRDGVTLDHGAELFRQVTLGLHYAHSKGVIHRDLKPSNIMLDDAGNAYLTDFGLAKLTESSGEITRSGTIVGTPAYMSPEQLRGEPLDPRSDIYSLGVILYNMVAGRLPFDTTSGDLVSVIYQHLEKPPPPPRAFNPNVPPEVEQVVLKALQKNRDDRFSSAVEMSRALNIALGRPPGSSDSLEPPISLPRHTPSSSQPAISTITSSRAPLITLASIVVVLLVAIGALLLQDVNNRAQDANATATALSWTPTPMPAPRVAAGVSAPSTDQVPTADQITAARERLRSDGFIAYIACTQDTEYHAGLAREIRDLGSSYGLEVRVYDSQADPYREITQIEKARSDGASALIVCPLDQSLLQASLHSAEVDNLPMVYFADNMEGLNGVKIGGDNYLIGLDPGRLAGRIIRDEMGGKADVVILDFPDRADIALRADGLIDGIKEYAPDARIIGRYLGGTRENGRASIQKLLDEGITFNVIASINDAGAFGAIEAMEGAGIDPASVIITSVDAEALAQQYISKGYFMRGSGQSARKEMAHALLNCAVLLLAGSEVPEFVQVPPGPMITRETLQTTAS